MATKRRAADAAAADAAAASDATKFLEEAQRAVDFTFAPTVVLPGDDVTAALTRTTRRVKLGASAAGYSSDVCGGNRNSRPTLCARTMEKGAGLKQLPDERIVCTNAGVLRYRPANRYWVDYNYKRVRVCMRLCLHLSDWVLTLACSMRRRWTTG